jgi:hypothetical protein
MLVPIFIIGKNRVYIYVHNHIRIIEIFLVVNEMAKKIKLFRFNRIINKINQWDEKEYKCKW